MCVGSAVKEAQALVSAAAASADMVVSREYHIFKPVNALRGVGTWGTAVVFNNNEGKGSRRRRQNNNNNNKSEEFQLKGIKKISVNSYFRGMVLIFSPLHLRTFSFKLV